MPQSSEKSRIIEKESLFLPAPLSPKDPERESQREIASQLQQPTASLSGKCPHCGAGEVKAEAYCPNCNAGSLEFGPSILHLVCQHLDFEKNFLSSLTHALVCRECARPLLTLGADYLRPGVLYHCQKCGAFEAKAELTWVCSSCHRQVEAPAPTPQAPASSELKPILEQLQRLGFQVQPEAQLKGKSGIFNSFSIFAQLGEEPWAIELVTKELPIEVSCVHSFFARALDCGVRHRVLIAVPKLEEAARILATSYGITLIEAPDTFLAAKLLEKQLAASKHSSSKAVLTTSKRSSVDIMADILRVAKNPSSKAEIMACGNLSYEQCQRYLPKLEKVELLRRSLEDGVHTRYQTTEKGREYLEQLFGEFGRIEEGQKSVWGSRKLPGHYS